MEGKALIGIDPKTMIVEIVASMKSNADDNLKEITTAGFLPVITTTEQARNLFGTKLGSVFDVLNT